MTLMAFVLMASMAVPVAGPQAAPVAEGWVTDHAGVLSEDVRDRLDKRLQDLEYRSGHEVLVWIDCSTSIEVGHGLQGHVPAALAARIAREEMGPRRRSGDVEGAVTSGVAGVIAALEPSSGPEPGRRVRLAKESGGDRWIIKHRFAVGMIVLFLALVLLARSPSLH